MSRNSNDKIHRLLLGILLDHENPDTEAFREVFQREGINLDRLINRVTKLIDAEREELKHSWLKPAKIVAESFKSQKHGVIANPIEFFDKLMSGALGPDLQQQALCFNRNKKGDTLTEDEIRTFLENCEILGILPAEKK